MNNTQEKRRFCDDCGFEYDVTEMKKRKDGKWFCFRCAPRNQL